MYLDPHLKQFEFEELKDGSLAVTFSPLSSKLSKKKYFVLFRPKTRYHELAVKVLRRDVNWVEISWFADFCIQYDKQVINAI